MHHPRVQIGGWRQLVPTSNVCVLLGKALGVALVQADGFPALVPHWSTRCAKAPATVAFADVRAGSEQGSPPGWRSEPRERAAPTLAC